MHFLAEAIAGSVLKHLNKQNSETEAKETKHEL